jgi:cytochrome c oxidase subunit II
MKPGRLFLSRPERIKRIFVPNGHIQEMKAVPGYRCLGFVFSFAIMRTALTICSAQITAQLGLPFFTVPAAAQTPMTYMIGHGAKTYPIVALTWGTLIISIVVVLIVSALLIAGLVRRRPPLVADAAGRLPVLLPAGGLSWIWIGVGATFVVLLATVIWTMAVLADVYAPPRSPGLRIEVTGHQWWWEVRYNDENPSLVFTTANEIHIPAGVPVQVTLRGADVIHSFWVPALTGKTDVIPGQSNVTWLEARKPGIYRGQCTEYCGAEHAKMALFVIADRPEDFVKWRDDQIAPAAAPPSPDIAAGQTAFTVRCGECHTVRGTDAGGVLGPDLSHLMRRRTIAAGLLDNTPGNLSGWIANPQQLKPGALMPNLQLTGQELSQIRRFLETLS